MPQSDISVSLVVGGQTMPVNGARMRQVGRVMMQFLKFELEKIAAEMVARLRRLYQVHKRQRIDGEPSLQERLAHALYQETVLIDRGGGVPDVQMSLFNLEQVYRRTSNRGKGDPAYPGWFALFESGYQGRMGESRVYGFLPLGQALALAQQAGERLNLDAGDKQNLLQYVQDRMAGKHGEGIMVALHEPLFFAYPEFGRAEKFVEPHEGFNAWNIYRQMITEARAGGYHPVKQAMERARARTLQWLRTGQ